MDMGKGFLNMSSESRIWVYKWLKDEENVIVTSFYDLREYLRTKR